MPTPAPGSGTRRRRRRARARPPCSDRRAASCASSSTSGSHTAWPSVDDHATSAAQVVAELIAQRRVRRAVEQRGLERRRLRQRRRVAVRRARRSRRCSAPRRAPTGTSARAPSERRCRTARAAARQSEGDLGAEQTGVTRRDADRSTAVAARADAAACPTPLPPRCRPTTRRRVRPGFHALPVTPCTCVRVQFVEPNSGAVVLPTITAPATRSRATSVQSSSAFSPAYSSDPCVCDSPRAAASSFTPIGTPANGPGSSPRRDPRIDRGGLFARTGSIEIAHRVEHGIEPNDPREEVIDDVSGSQRTGTDVVGNLHASRSHSSVMVRMVEVQATCALGRER